MGIDSLVRKVKIFALAGLTALVASCMPVRKQYVEPRLGMVAPIAAESEDDPAVEEHREDNVYAIIGVTYGVSGKVSGSPKERIGLETSLEYFHSSVQYMETDSLLLRVDATYPIRDINPSIYLTGGLAFLSEFATIDIPAPFNVHDKESDTNIGLGFGADMRFDAAGIEDVGVRLAYIAIAGSDNVKGMFILTGGYKF